MGRKKNRYSKAVKEEILNLFNASVPVQTIAKQMKMANTSVRYKIIDWVGKKKYNEQMKKTKSLSSKNRVTGMILNRIIKAQEKLNDESDEN
jgi:transposase-like protein